MQAAAAVDHLNIVPLYASGQPDGTLFIATWLVRGDDLARSWPSMARCRQAGPWQIQSAVASALDAASGWGGGGERGEGEGEGEGG